MEATPRIGKPKYPTYYLDRLFPNERVEIIDSRAFTETVFMDNSDPLGGYFHVTTYREQRSPPNSMSNFLVLAYPRLVIPANSPDLYQLLLELRAQNALPKLTLTPSELNASIPFPTDEDPNFEAPLLGLGNEQFRTPPLRRNSREWNTDSLFPSRLIMKPSEDGFTFESKIFDTDELPNEIKISTSGSVVYGIRVASPRSTLNSLVVGTRIWRILTNPKKESKYSQFLRVLDPYIRFEPN